MKMATKQRMFTASELPREAAIGKTIYMVNTGRCLEGIRRRGGWKGNNLSALQAETDFSFDGTLFTDFTRDVLHREIRNIYFPAVYVGKVAQALAAAGCDMFTSDLSGYWTANARRLGFHSEKRGFEDIPDRKFDAFVCFEPYCIPAVAAQLAVMEALSRSLPVIQILSFTPELNMNFGLFRRMGEYPQVSSTMERTGYDYGAEYAVHATSLRDGKRFMFVSVIPDEQSKERASIDLQMLRQQDQWVAPEVSIAALARTFKTSGEVISASLLRLREILNSRMVDDRPSLFDNALGEKSDFIAQQRLLLCLRAFDHGPPAEALRQLVQHVKITE